MPAPTSRGVAGMSVVLTVLVLLLLRPCGAHRHLHGVRQPSKRSCGHAHMDFSEQNALAAQAEEAVYGTSLAAVNSSSGALKATVRASPLPLAGLQLQLQFHLIEWHGRNSLTDWETPAVSQQQLDQQVVVINKDYKTVGLQFVAAPPITHVNWTWTGSCYDRAAEIVSRVVVAPATTVNVIICDLFDSTAGIMGYTPGLPTLGEDSRLQAVLIDYHTLPGGPFARYSQGRTLTHELGHYFGLAHPFGSCAPDADGIADTPAELDAASGCPVKRNTCPVQSGLDPVWSFMDYSDDECMKRFSPGQIARMQAVTVQMRPQLVEAGSAGNSSTAAQGGALLPQGEKAPAQQKKKAAKKVTSIKAG